MDPDELNIVLRADLNEVAARLCRESNADMRCLVHRQAASRGSEIQVAWRPRLISASVTVSDGALEDSRTIIDLLDVAIDRAARMVRGQAIAELIAQPHDAPRSEDAQKLLPALLSALDAFTPLTEIAVERLAQRLTHLITKHGTSEQCDRFALKLMAAVEPLRSEGFRR